MGGDRDTALADLLFRMNGEIRADIRNMKDDVCERIADVRSDVGDVRAKQDEHGQRLTALEAGGTFGLTKKQKAAIVSGGIAVAGACADGARHLVVWIVAWLKAGAPGAPVR